MDVARRAGVIGNTDGTDVTEGSVKNVIKNKAPKTPPKSPIHSEMITTFIPLEAGRGHPALLIKV